jgi:hypothetical protein
MLHSISDASSPLRLTLFGLLPMRLHARDKVVGWVTVVFTKEIVVKDGLGWMDCDICDDAVSVPLIELD